MTTSWLNPVGLVLQLLGAGYLVWIAFRGWRVFKRIGFAYKTGVAYGQLGTILTELAQAQSTQFQDQLVAFVLLTLGTLAQLIA